MPCLPRCAFWSLLLWPVGCGSSRPPPATGARPPAETYALSLDVTHVAEAEGALLVAGLDGDWRGCVYVVDPRTAASRVLRCAAGERVRGLAGTDTEALVVVGPEGQSVAEGRLLAMSLRSDGGPPRVLAEGPLEGPMVLHDGVVDAVQGEGVLRVELVGGATPTRLDACIYLETRRVVWHRGRLYGLRGERLVGRDAAGLRRPVEAIRWQAIDDEGPRLWGVDRRQDGVVELERWTHPDARPVGIAVLPGGEGYALAATPSAVVVASGRTLTVVRVADGRSTPAGSIPGEGPLRLQGVGEAVFAVWQEVSCAGRGALAGAEHHADPCAPVAQVRRVWSGR